jgi:hypothetical protein
MGVAGSGGSWEPGSVDGDDCGAGPPTDLGGRAGGLEGVSQYVHPAVEVEDNMPRFDSVNGHLGGRDSTQCGGRGHDRISQQRPR